MTCSQIDPLIQMALDGRLSPAVRTHLDAHMADCGTCRAAWDEYRSLGRITSDWARRPILTADPGEAFTSQVMAQIAAQSASRPIFSSRQAIVWIGLAAFILTALSFWTEPLLQAHVPHVIVPSGSSFLVALTPDRNVQPLMSIWQDTQRSWQALSAHPLALPAWVPGVLAVTLCLNAFFAWRTRHYRRETTSQ